MNRNVFIMVCCFMATACRLPQIAFREQDLDVGLMKQLVLEAGGYRGTPETDSLKKVMIENDKAFLGLRLYRCILEDAYLVRNHLVEETIRNVEGSASDGPEPLRGNQYRLYMAVMGTQAGEPAVFIPSVFDASDRCLRLGPAWMGSWNAGEFSFYKTLTHKPDRSGGPGRWYYDRKASEDRKTGSVMLSGNLAHLSKQSIRFVTDHVENINLLDSFRVIRIFRRSPSQIGAEKGLLFDVPAIFHDSAALRFVRVDKMSAQ
jgi:hypothetical protein